MEEYIKIKNEMEECRGYSMKKLQFFLIIYKLLKFFHSKKVNFYLTIVLFIILPQIILGFTTFNLIMATIFQLILWFGLFIKQSNPNREILYIIQIIEEFINDKSK